MSLQQIFATDIASLAAIGPNQLSTGAPYWNSTSVGIGTSNPSFQLHQYLSSGTTYRGNQNGSITLIEYASTTVNAAAYGTSSNHPLLFQTNNYERMRIDTSGNLGIGTSSPGYQVDSYNSSTNILAVRSGVQPVVRLVDPYSNVSDYTIFSNTAILRTTTNFPLAFAVNGTEAMRIVSGGNVGIGTISPVSTLNLSVSSVNAIGPILTLSNPAGGNNSGGQINFVTGNGVSQPIEASIYSLDDGAYGGNLILATKTTGAAANALTERLRATSTGYVLVGLNNGSVVSNSTQGAMNICTVGNYSSTTIQTMPNALTLQNPTNNSNSGYGVSLRFNMSSSADGVGKYAAIAGIADGNYSNATALAFYTTSYANGGVDNVTQKMYINNSGNIGAPSGSNIYNASDMRLKQNIQLLTKGLDTINALQSVSFNWITDFCKEENDKTMYGFIAQNTQLVDPNLVEPFGLADKIIVGDTVVENPLRVNEKFIIPILVKALQELNAKFDDYVASHP